MSVHRSSRRRTLLGLSAAAAVAVVRPAAAQALGRPGGQQLNEAIAEFARGAPVRTGRVKLEIATLVDNGNVSQWAEQLCGNRGSSVWMNRCLTLMQSYAFLPVQRSPHYSDV